MRCGRIIEEGWRNCTVVELTVGENGNVRRVFPTIPEQSSAAYRSLPVTAEATMLGLDQPQRAALGETLRELANLAAAALVLGQLVTELASLTLMLLGAVAWLGLVALGVLLAGERRW
jgi:hypothetical protein